MPSAETATLYSLNREAARRLFGCREPAALSAFLEEELPGLAPEPADRAELGSAWRVLQEVLERGPASPHANFQSMLGQALTGGRPLPAGEGWEARVMRPDLVPHMAEEFAALDSAERDRMLARGETDPVGREEVSEAFAAVAELYRRAAENGACVLFVARPVE